MPKKILLHPPPAPNQSSGYVLWPIIVGSLVIVVGAVGILARSSGGQFGALFSVEAREAKDAAESGIEEVISSMNSPENRGTLVASRDPSKWWAGAVPANPCAPTSPSSPLPNLKKYYQSTGSASNVVAGSSSSSVDSKHFYIFKISIKSSAGTSTYTRNGGSIPSAPTTSGAWTSSSASAIDHASAINLLNSANTGLISVSAVGYSRRPNGTYVQSIVTKEYEIVPKCCGRSFGNAFSVASGVSTPTPAHGFDSRDCRSGGQGIGELGFVIGVNGNGLVTKAAGKSFSLYETNAAGDLVATDQILTQNRSIDCSLAANASQCQLNNDASGGTTAVSSYPIDLDPLPSNPSTRAKGCIKGTIALDTKLGSSMEGLSTSSSSFCPGSETLVPGTLRNGFKDVGGAVGAVGKQKCTGSGTQYLGTDVPLPYDYILNSSGVDIATPVSTRCYVADSKGTSATALSDYCVENALLGTVDCSIGYISLTSGSLNIDTTSKKVRLFLYDSAWSGVGGVSGGEIKLTGGGTINHVYSGSAATLAQSDRLAIYGNLPSQLFSFGGTSLSLAAQIYLPYGTLNVGGTTTLNGILWTNDLALNGDLTINTPPASAICKVIAGCSPPNPDLAPIAWDWVARSPNATSLFN